jgi:hypothetical protein
MLIAEGMSLRKVCLEDGMPDKTTVLRWLARHEEFRTQYAEAKEIGAMVWAEEILEIADDGSNDYMEKLDDEGKAAAWKFMGENVQRSKLRVDSRKWLLSKLMPKKYGDKIQQELSGPNGSPIQTKATFQFVGVNANTDTGPGQVPATDREAEEG